MSQFRYLGSLISRWILHKRDLEQNSDGKESMYGEKKLFTGTMNMELKKMNNEMVCSTVCSRDVDVDSVTQPLKCGYGEEWKRQLA